MNPYQIWLGEVADPDFPRFFDPHRPQLLLGSAREDPIKRMKRLSDGSLSGSAFAQEFGIRPRMDLLESLPEELGALGSYRKKDDASGVRAAVRDHLLGLGYVLDPAGGNEVYTVYVIDLVNHSETDPRPWVYVGETSKTPEERFDEHKNGVRSNSTARQHGSGLNYELMAEIPHLRFKQDALWLEERTGEVLRRRGYRVEGAH